MVRVPIANIVRLRDKSAQELAKIEGKCAKVLIVLGEGQHGGSAAAEGTLESYLLGSIGDPAP